MSNARRKKGRREGRRICQKVEKDENREVPRWTLGNYLREKED